MSAMDFPSNPVDGQTSGNYVYSATSGAWKSKPIVGSVTIQSPTVPLVANSGDIWINTSDGTAFSYFDDGTSRQWMEIISSGVPNLATKANLSGASFTGDVAISSSGTLIRGDNGTATIVTNSASKTPLIAKAASGQTANIQEWQDATSTAKSWIDSTGRFFSVGTGTQTTVGASNELGGMAVRSTSSTAAAMSFHVPTLIATNIGVQPDQKFSIGGWSLPADSLTIDTTGRMKVPSQPSFTATRNDDGNNRAAGDYVFDKVWHNTGGYYSSSTGRFTAPIAGRYLFITQLQGWGTTAGTLMNVYFRKNGTEYPSANSSEGVNGIVNKAVDSGYHANVAVTSVIDLAANDYVTVYTSGLRGMQSHFSGHLLG